jgi:hypothetical protein
MSVPNLKHVVQQVRDAQAWDFSTKEALCAYSNAVVVALHAADPNFGHLKKSAGQNHCTDAEGRFCAVDVALYKPTGQVIDFIGSAGINQPNPVTWNVGPEGEYPADKWFAPVASGEPPAPTPIPEPAPVVDLEPLRQRIQLLEARAAGFAEIAAEIVKQIGIVNQQIADLSGKVGQEYEGTGKVGFFGGSFTVVSRPKV